MPDNRTEENMIGSSQLVGKMSQWHSYELFGLLHNPQSYNPFIIWQSQCIRDHEKYELWLKCEALWI